MKYSQIPNVYKPERVAVVGLPGTGKTTLASKLSEKFNITIIDTENDAACLKKLPVEWQERINYIKIPDSAAFPVASETLMHLFKNNKANICVQHGKNECALCKKNSAYFDLVDLTKFTAKDILILNTGTQLSSSIFSHITKGRPVETKAERDDWGQLRKFTEFFASQWQAAEYNLVVIFHAIESELEDKKKRLVPSFGSAGMSGTIGGKFDHIVYTDVINKKFKAFSDATYSSGIQTKSRTDFRIEDLSEPSLIPIFEKTGEEDVLTIAAEDKSGTDSTTSIPKLSNVSAGQAALNNLKAATAGVQK